MPPAAAMKQMPRSTEPATSLIFRWKMPIGRACRLHASTTVAIALSSRGRLQARNPGAEREIARPDKDEVNSLDRGDSIDVLDPKRGFDLHRDQEVVVGSPHIFRERQPVTRCLDRGPHPRSPAVAHSDAAATARACSAVSMRGTRMPAAPASSDDPIQSPSCVGTRTTQATPAASPARISSSMPVR